MSEDAGKTGGRRLPRAAREAQILQVAAEMFAAQGFHATSMDDVAAACGVTKPMIYSYFGSKPGLMAALLQRTGRELLAGLALMAAIPDPEARIRATLDLLIGRLYEQTASWRVILSAMRGDGPLAEQARGYRAALIHAMLITLAELAPPDLHRAIARRRVSPYAHALLGAAEAGSEWWLSTPGVSRAETEATATKVLDAMLVPIRRDLAASV
ncbi:TetR/AcrR family transcriptional regulator [Zavarzinia sp.]|uniref:TetR/AcrR family transcriptional regulator n=1 Tax=Zavarzinia sp. TaxID=2027920 RepID=UPI003BB6D08B|nr:TetR/AcrR family transcriptional regulator [Zavarzinia sp.]